MSEQNDRATLASLMTYDHPRLLRQLIGTSDMDMTSARQAFDDMKRFLYLCATTGEPLMPTKKIDEVWHNFILYTRDYAEFCNRYFGFVVHHEPWTEAQVAASDWTIVRKTRHVAETIFGATLSTNWDFGGPERGSRHPTCSDSSCFPAGSLILMANGKTKPIETIAIDDLVMSYDGSNPVADRVLALEAPVRDHLFSLAFDGARALKLTREHPLFTSTGWRSLSPESTAAENDRLRVAKLEIGDAVYTSSGETATLRAVDLSLGDTQTYNIKHLSRYACFFVDGFLAHTKAQEQTAAFPQSA